MTRSQTQVVLGMSETEKVRDWAEQNVCKCSYNRADSDPLETDSGTEGGVAKEQTWDANTQLRSRIQTMKRSARVRL